MRPSIYEALNETFDLFIELGASDEQADFPVVYAIGLVGRAGLVPHGLHSDLTPLFETIIKEVPPPKVEMDAPPKLLVTTLEYDKYKGQIGVGRLMSGVMKRQIRRDEAANAGGADYPAGCALDWPDRVSVHVS